MKNVVFTISFLGSIFTQTLYSFEYIKTDDDDDDDPMLDRRVYDDSDVKIATQMSLYETSNTWTITKTTGKFLLIPLVASMPDQIANDINKLKIYNLLKAAEICQLFAQDKDFIKTQDYRKCRKLLESARKNFNKKHYRCLPFDNFVKRLNEYANTPIYAGNLLKKPLASPTVDRLLSSIFDE